MDAVGQLSLNEDEQVRYHGKASGLHLLGGKERDDSRNEDGIWSVYLGFVSAHYLLIFCCQAIPSCPRLAPTADR